MKPTCIGPACARPAARGDLCDSHYRQQLAGQPLRPIRRRVVSLRSLLAQVRAAATRTGPGADRELARAAHRFHRAARLQRALRRAQQAQEVSAS